MNFCDRTECFSSRFQDRPPYYSDPQANEEDHAVSAWHCDGKFLLRYGAAAEFLIDGNGGRIQVCGGATTTDEAIGAYLTGPVLGFALRLRGALCLHASAIRMGGDAFAVMGARGAGKSTLAASFSHSGRTVLSDDILRLQEAGGSFFAYPSGARFKLWPDSLQAVYGESESFARLAPDTEKRVVPLTEPGDTGAVPLRAVFLLGERSSEREAPLIEKMQPMDAMVSLASHTYANYLLTPEMRKEEFVQLQRLVSSVEVCKITPRADLTELVKLREFVSTYFEKRFETI